LIGGVGDLLSLVPNLIVFYRQTVNGEQSDGQIGWLFVTAFVVAPGINEPVVPRCEIVDKKLFFFGKYIGARVVGREISTDVEGEEKSGESDGEGETPRARAWPG
jgi:hypothetical protein